jgi:hypothetical protein
MLQLPAGDGAWSGVVSLYSIIHMTTEERAAASREFARVIARGGWLLVAFHVDSDEFAVGDVNHLTTWFGESVEVDTQAQTGGGTACLGADRLLSARPQLRERIERVHVERVAGGREANRRPGVRSRREVPIICTSAPIWALTEPCV